MDKLQTTGSDHTCNSAKGGCRCDPCNCKNCNC
jgi:hypothetical protein